jgi:hypothetical protein
MLDKRNYATEQRPVEERYYSAPICWRGST